MPLIQFDDVSYAPPGSPPTVDGVSFDVEPGELVAFVGRSGAGKSTLLRLVNRLLVPGRGRVLVEGRDTREWNAIALRRRTGYVLQDVGLFPHLTIAQNVGLVPRLTGWRERAIDDRVDELLRLAGLDPSAFRDRWPEELSGGQRQRVGFARALVTDPPIVLMDEPFGALDPVTRLEVRAEFTRIQSQVRKTVLLVTHDLHEALLMASRVGVLDGGRLVAFGSGADVRVSDQPAVKQLFDTLAPA